MPFGLLNEHHEPTNFYGVQRNFVETLIIPSTWREGGFGLHGNTAIGLNWDAGVTTGLNLGGWNINPEDPQYRTALDLENNGVAPMQATHQELSLANGHHLSQYLSLNYSGIPGLLAGAAVFTGEAAVPTMPAGLPSQRVTLWEGHARWTPGAAELSAVYAQGHISNTSTFNLANAGASNPLPSEFLGYYLQGAYTVWENGGYRLAPFARWEHYDMGASYEGIPPGIHDGARRACFGWSSVAAAARSRLDRGRQFLCQRRTWYSRSTTKPSTSTRTSRASTLEWA